MTEVLNLSHQRLTALPDNLPQNLPNNLPQSLQKLYCFGDQLTILPKILPRNLQILSCSYNQLTTLPDNLPPNLQYLSCSNNQITALPDILPQSLQYLYCYRNQIIALPDILPQNLQELYCSDNQLTTLPDLPQTLGYVNLRNNPLEANYPLIFTFNQTEDIIEYVNLCNAIRRKKAWLALVNAGNVFLERYMRRMMHPSRLAALEDNPDLDVEEYMQAYIDNL